MYHNKRVRMTTGISCYVRDWNPKRQRIYERHEISYSNEYNKHLNKIEGSLNTLLDDLKQQNSKIEIQELKKLIQEQCFSLNSIQTKDEFWNNFESFISFKKNNLKDVVDYDLALRKHLKSMENKLGIYLQFSDFHRNSSFINSFDSYLRFEALNIKKEKGLAINTIGKQYKNLKVFLNWCFDEQLVQPFSIKHIIPERIDIDSIYLTEKELLKLEKLDLLGSIKICRDLFLIGCETGLRFSDLCSIHKSQIKEGMLEIRPQKTRNSTNKRILIPLSKRVITIIKTYNEDFPLWSVKRLNDFNTLIKKCGQMAQINDIQNIEKHTSGSIKEYQLQKWELLSSHSCRRTFCTLKFLSGMPAQVIMKFSGHTTEKNFLKYLKLDAELNATQYRAYFH